MDETAIFKLSYGLFFLGAKFDNSKNICVVNTVMQVTQEPLRISVTVLKGNYTAELIQKSQNFSVCVMSHDANLDDIAHFGQQSGRNVDKLSGYDVQTDKLGNPLYINGCCASLCAKVIETIDLGTHFLFIADLVDAKNLSSAKPLTYSDYRLIKAGTLKPHETENSEENKTTKETFQCSVCHYIYDGDIPFEDLPDDYVCPICKKPKSAFFKVS